MSISQIFAAAVIVAALTACGQSDDAAPVSPAPDMTLEQKIAAISAGRLLSPDDTSIARARRLIADVSQCYKIEQTNAANMATTLTDIAQKDGKNIDVLDILDALLILCGDNADRDAFADIGSRYITVRVKADQTHHQAVRSILILQSLVK
jgi:hypothetical protein